MAADHDRVRAVLAGQDAPARSGAVAPSTPQQPGAHRPSEVSAVLYELAMLVVNRDGEGLRGLHGVAAQAAARTGVPADPAAQMFLAALREGIAAAARPVADARRGPALPDAREAVATQQPVRAARSQAGAAKPPAPPMGPQLLGSERGEVAHPVVPWLRPGRGTSGPGVAPPG